MQSSSRTKLVPFTAHTAPSISEGCRGRKFIPCLVTDNKPSLSQRIRHYITDEFKKFFFLHQPMNRSAIKSRSGICCTSNIGGIDRYFGLNGVLFANIYHLQVVNYDMYQTRSMVTVLNCFRFLLLAD